MDSFPIAGDLENLIPTRRPSILTFEPGVAKVLPQYLATIIVTIGGFICGTIIAWSSPAAVKLENCEDGFPVDENDMSWIGGIMPIGAILGCILTALVVDILGRKNTMIVVVLPCTIGWSLIVWADSVLMLCLGRFILGTTCGSFTIICPMYTAEICQKEVRGTLGTIFQLQVVSGILFLYILGSFLSLFHLSLICMVLPTVYLVFICMIPESPVYHLKLGRIDEAKQSLQSLRGPNYNILTELVDLSALVDSSSETEVIPFSIAIRSPAAVKGLIIGLGVMFFQQFSGVNAVIFYAASIFKDAGSSFSYNVSSIIVGSVCVAFTYLSTLIIDKLGRRVLLLFSSVVMTGCTCGLGVYFYALSHNYDMSHVQIFPILSVCGFIVAFSLGFGPIPYMLISEIFSPQIKGTASSIVCLFNWVCCFLVTKYFCILSTRFGSDVTFGAFSFLSFLGIFFVYFVIPETKGKSMEEIQSHLAGSDDS
ncbi:LOW QUALITY PROTEIN: facilitated trehalose transporter Tret1 [Bemisia tabaci]|uniref:LOW QUALITY PROTEIN: facilitated trehalose transporter Tret1 n=1 Tax=Bemisia tabaci TaxID=7038 RepID=UPI003B283645